MCVCALLCVFDVYRDQRGYQIFWSYGDRLCYLLSEFGKKNLGFCEMSMFFNCRGYFFIFRKLFIFIGLYKRIFFLQKKLIVVIVVVMFFLKFNFIKYVNKKSWVRVKKFY